jgi:hypothetical protein
MTEQSRPPKRHLASLADFDIAAGVLGSASTPSWCLLSTA